MKIYTKTGDKGETSLYGGKRVAKSSLRVQAYGDVDELNSLIGLAISKQDLDQKLKLVLERVQHELFNLGADLATPEDVNEKLVVERVEANSITQLESEIDKWQASLPKLKQFILPGGSETAAIIFLARAVCRRAERNTVSLSKQENINQDVITYLNRLSDWLFVFARLVNLHHEQKETAWSKQY